MSDVNITVYDGSSSWEAVRKMAAIKKELADGLVGDLVDPTPPGTQVSPAVIPEGPAGQKRKFTPSPGFYQGFPEVTANKRWEFYWNGSSWQIADLGNLPMADTSTLAPKVDSSGSPVLRSKKSSNVNEIIAGTNEQQAGYYAYGTGAFVPFSNYWSKKIDLQTQQSVGTLTIESTVFGEATAAAVFLDTNNNNLGFQNRGTTTQQNLTNYQVTPPANTRYILLSCRSTTGAKYAVIRNAYQKFDEDIAYAGGSQKTLKAIEDDLAAQGSEFLDLIDSLAPEENSAGVILRAKVEKEEGAVQGVNEAVSGYYSRTNGTFVANSGYRATSFDVRGIDLSTLSITTVIPGGAVGLATYYDALGAFISSEGQGSNDTTETITKQKINPPANTAFVGVIRYGNVDLYGVLFGLISKFPELAYKSDIQAIDQSISDIDIALSNLSGDTSKEDVLLSGDSITIQQGATGYSPKFISLLNPKSSYNNAVGSSNWSKKMRSIEGTMYRTQDFSDPNFAGISSGSGNTTDPVELQKRLNNCAVIHIQKFISEFKAGTRVRPTLCVLAYGTNADTGWGNSHGTVQDALAGAEIQLSNTYTMTNAMRWCIQTLLTEFPDLKLFIAGPIQRASDENDNLRLNKIPLIREVAAGMSVPFIDLFAELGINQKFEVPNGAGRYLRDGLHENAAGATKHANFLYNRIVKYLQM